MTTEETELLQFRARVRGGVIWADALSLLAPACHTCIVPVGGAHETPKSAAAENVMNSIGTVVVDSDHLIFLYNQDHQIALSGDELLSMCIAAARDMYYTRREDPALYLHLLEVLRPSTICGKMLPVQFDVAIASMSEANDWEQWPYVALRVRDDHPMVEIRRFASPTRWEALPAVQPGRCAFVPMNSLVQWVKSQD